MWRHWEGNQIKANNDSSPPGSMEGSGHVELRSLAQGMSLSITDPAHGWLPPGSQVPPLPGTQASAFLFSSVWKSTKIWFFETHCFSVVWKHKYLFKRSPLLPRVIIPFWNWPFLPLCVIPFSTEYVGPSLLDTYQLFSQNCTGPVCWHLYFQLLKERNLHDSVCKLLACKIELGIHS